MNKIKTKLSKEESVEYKIKVMNAFLDVIRTICIDGLKAGVDSGDPVIQMEWAMNYLKDEFKKLEQTDQANE